MTPDQRGLAMRNASFWKPTKFVRTHRGFAASSDSTVVAVGSRLMVDVLIEKYLAAINAHARGRLLDLGCGHVPLYDVYRARVTASVCVDWRHSLHKNPYVDLFADLNQPIPLASEAFDTVLLTDVLEHIAEPQLLMSEIARILRPLGKVIVGVPFLYQLHEQPHDYYRYTEFALRRFCSMCELSVVSLEPIGGVVEVMMDLTAKLVETSPRWSALHLRLCRLMRKSAGCRRLSARSARRFPLGYCLVARR